MDFFKKLMIFILFLVVLFLAVMSFGIFGFGGLIVFILIIVGGFFIFSNR